MSLHFENKKILIWGKTYPELSTRHKETVCTGGCTEDGRPVRLYPVDFRYLMGEGKYSLYDWIEVPIAKTDKDRRPESYKLRAEQIRILRHVGTERGWEARRNTIFRDTSWHFGCLDELKDKQKATGHSLGMVKVASVEEVMLSKRDPGDSIEHRKKLAALKASGDLFGVEAKDLGFIDFRIRIRWRCADGKRCPSHSASVLDWGLSELGRRDGKEKALQKMEQLANLKRVDLHLYMGNLFTRQRIFSCIGLWYPQRAVMASAGQMALDLPE